MKSTILSTLTSLRRDKRGLAYIEFAFSAPILLGLSCYGLELGNLALVRMKLSQMALGVADNMSRVGQNTALNTTQVREVDVVDSLTAAKLMVPDVFTNGRVIISSLQQNASGGQWIAWQRCRGVKNVSSTYGTQGTGSTGTSFAGMGPGGAVVQAPSNSAVIYLELFYDYQPLFPAFWSDSPGGSFWNSPLLNNSSKSIKYGATFIVRDRREIAQNDTGGNIQNNKYGISNPQNPLSGQPAPVMSCSAYTA